MNRSSSHIMLLAAQVLIGIWALWWSFFAIASSLGPPLTAGWDWLYPGSLVLGSLALAGLTWRRPFLGAAIGAIVAWGIVAWYLSLPSPQLPLETRLFVLGTLPFPLLLVAGLIWGSRHVAPGPGVDPGHGLGGDHEFAA